MAQRAGNADVRERVLPVDVFDGPFQSDDCVQLEQRDGGCGGVEVGALEQTRWQRVSIHLESDAQRRGRTHRRADHFMHAKGVGPERLVTERIESEDVSSAHDLGGSGRGRSVVATGQQRTKESGPKKRSVREAGGAATPGGHGSTYRWPPGSSVISLTPSYPARLRASRKRCSPARRTVIAPRGE